MKKHRLIKRICAAGTALTLAAAAFAGTAFSTAVQAAGTPKVCMSLLAGGSALGLEFTLKLPEGEDIRDYSIDVNGQTFTEQTFSITAPNAHSMDEIYTVQICKHGEAFGAAKTISINDYLKQIKETESQSEFHNLADALLRYGQAAKAYWENGEMPDCSGISIENDALAFDREEFLKNLNCRDEADLPYTYYGMNLQLLGELKYNLFFKLKAGKTFEDAAEYLTGAQNFVVSSAGTPVDNGDGFVRLQFPVPAASLRERIMFTFANLGTAEVGPMSYITMAVGGSDAALASLCKALYSYGVEASRIRSAEQEPVPFPEGPHLTQYSYVRGCADLDDYVQNNGCAVAALTDDDYEKYIGGWIRITCNGQTMDALVADIMSLKKSENSSRKPGDVDMDLEHFKMLTGCETGDLEISWEPIENPLTDKTVSIKFKAGSSKYWSAVQIQNAPYSVKSVKTGDQELKIMRTNDDYKFRTYFFETPEGCGLGSDGSYKFTVTDQNGNSYLLTTESGFMLPATGELPQDTVVRCIKADIGTN